MGELEDDARGRIRERCKAGAEKWHHVVADDQGELLRGLVIEYEWVKSERRGDKVMALPDVGTVDVGVSSSIFFRLCPGDQVWTERAFCDE